MPKFFFLLSGEIPRPAHSDKEGLARLFFISYLQSCVTSIAQGDWPGVSTPTQRIPLWEGALTVALCRAWAKSPERQMGLAEVWKRVKFGMNFLTLFSFPRVWNTIASERICSGHFFKQGIWQIFLLCWTCFAGCLVSPLNNGIVIKNVT